MFLPWSALALDAFFLVLDFLAVLCFQAALAHYSRKARGYAHSIRWIQQGGLWELATVLRNSNILKAKAPMRKLLATFLASGTLSLFLFGIKALAKESVAEGNRSQELVSSRQAVVGQFSCALAGWNFHIPYDTEVEEALTMAINSTMGNPQAVFTKRYHPTVTEYEPACNRFDVNTPDRTYSVLPNNGCATISFYPFAIDLKSNLTRIYTVRGSAERVRVVIPRLANAETHKLVPNTVADVGLSVRVDYGDEACMTPNKKYLVLDATRTGITSSPMTAITKCLLKTGESIILSTSAIRFLAPSNKQFHAVATSLFGTQDELVQAMEDSVNNSTLTTLPANALEELVILEIETTNTEVVALMCIWARQSVAEAPHIACAYTITSVLITKPLRMNPSIAQQLVNKGLNPSDSPITAIMTLSHLPQASTNRVSYNIPKILKEAEAATRYIASLGNNFVVDWEGSALYVMFDTFEILKGYDVPRWFFIAVIAAMVVCFILWFGTETLLNARYRESLYVAVSKELVGGKHAKPRLHRFNPRTLLFDGQYPLVASTSQIDTMGVDSEADRPFDEKTPIDTLPQHFIH